MPGKARSGKSAAVAKVKQILPHCDDDDINAALQNAFGDAEQAVIALTSSGDQEWTSVDKKAKRKPAGRGGDRPFERSDGPDRGHRESGYGQGDERRRDRNGRGSRGGRAGDPDAPGGRGRGRGGVGRGRGRGFAQDGDGPAAQPRRDTSSPVRNYGQSPEPSFGAGTDDNQVENGSYGTPASSRPASRIIPPAQLPEQGSTWASKLKASTAPAQPREPTPEEPQPEPQIVDERGDARDDEPPPPAAWGAPAGQQGPPSEASGGHEAFAEFGASPPPQQASSWGQPVLRPDWSTQPNPSQSMTERNADVPFDDGAALPSAPPQHAPEGAAFDLADLHGALPVGGYEADPSSQSFLPQAVGGSGGSGGFGSGPVEPKKGEDHLPALFPIDAAPAPAPAPQAPPQPQDEARPAYVPQAYSQFGQPQMAARDGGGQGSRPASSAAASVAQAPPQAAHLPEQLSQTPPQAASASSQGRGGQGAAQAGAGGQRGMLPASQAYDAYGGDLHGGEAPAFLSQAQKGGDYAGAQQAPQPGQGGGQGAAPQQQAAPPQHLQRQPSPGSQAPPHGMPQGDLAHHGGKGDMGHLDGGLDKGAGGDAGQQHMQGQFAGQLPDMHGWGSMPQADMFGMRSSGHPGLTPGMAAMMQPGMQPGMPPAPQMPQQFMAPGMQGGYGYPSAGSNPGYQQMFPPPSQYMQGGYNMSQGGYGGYAPPYGYAPQYPGASGPGGYPSNGSSYGGKAYPGGGGEFARGASGGAAGAAANSTGRSRGAAATAGRGGKQQPKGNRGGGSGNATPAGYQQGAPEQFAPGPAMYGGGYDQWAAQGQPRYDVPYGKDAKSMGGQAAYGYGGAGMGAFDAGHAAAFQHQQPQYPGGGYQQQQGWGADKGFGNKGAF